MFPLSALKMMEGLRRQWLPDRSDADGRQLPEPPFIRGDHGAWAMTRARALAREMVQRAQRVAAEERMGTLEVTPAGPPVQPGAPSVLSTDTPAGAGASGSDVTGDVEVPADVETDEDGAFMQLTIDEEARLHTHNVQDEARKHLRSLLVALNQFQDRGDGPEYRWGVQLVVESWDAALDVLARRTTNLGGVALLPGDS